MEKQDDKTQAQVWCDSLYMSHIVEATTVLVGKAACCGGSQGLRTQRSPVTYSNGTVMTEEGHRLMSQRDINGQKDYLEYFGDDDDPNHKHMNEQ